MATELLNGKRFSLAVAGGASNLRRHAGEVNDLNVFPIPDGDTGDNMLMTMEGGMSASPKEDLPLGKTAGEIARGMLLGARGNSGVILSQFFAGIADGLRDVREADAAILGDAFRGGVERAYSAVMTPTEGTILTVAKDATAYACACRPHSAESFLECFIREGKRALDRTPDQLACLREAGVVDSGGAGLIYVAEGMLAALSGVEIPDGEEPQNAPKTAVNVDLFTEDTTLEYGYCTELLLRLQKAKCDPDAFDVRTLTDYLTGIGNSVVAVKTGTIVKLHVHTMTPDQVLSFCQRYGEFLTVKIENMMLQHSGVVETKAAAEKPRPRHKIGVVAVVTGDGNRRAFYDFGCDEVIDGGQTMNPSAEEILDAVRSANADTVFVLPDNGNIQLAAEQAAALSEDTDVRVIPTKNVGEAYAILSMMDPDAGSADEVEEAMRESMEGVLTVEVTKAIRDATVGGTRIACGDYVGILGKEILSSDPDRERAACRSLDGIDLSDHALAIIVRGADADEEGSAKIASCLSLKYPDLEIAECDGGQPVYDYYLILE